MIKQYRESKGIVLNAEHKLMEEFSGNFFTTNTLLQKLESFRNAIKQVPGTDIANILWEKSPSSEEWLERRTIFTRSIAVMSMVGYILGLGDRHPSNLMMIRYLLYI